MPFRSARTSVVVLLLGVCVAVVYLFSKREGATPRPAKENSRLGEDIRVEGVRHFELNGESILWAIDAEEARFFQPKSVVEFDNVRITFYPSAGGDMTLVARKGYYETNTRNMSADDGVTGMTDQGYWFWTPRMSYDAASKEITSTDKVILRRDRLSIEGIGLQGSVETRNFHILSAVKATYSATK